VPVLSLAHSKFWRQRANPVVPALPFVIHGYPAWQASVIGFLVGGLQAYWERFVYAFRWFRWAWRCPLSVDQQRALTQAIAVVQSPAWRDAQAVVFDTSRAEGFHDYNVWNHVSEALAQDIGWAENMWRHMRAMLAHRQAHPTLDNPTRNLLIELAYHEFAASGRGKPTMDR
jgi:hypothetical protein